MLEIPETKCFVGIEGCGDSIIVLLVAWYGIGLLELILVVVCIPANHPRTNWCPSPSLPLSLCVYVCVCKVMTLVFEVAWLATGDEMCRAMYMHVAMGN